MVFAADEALARFGAHGDRRFCLRQCANGRPVETEGPQLHRRCEDSNVQIPGQGDQGVGARQTGDPSYGHREDRRVRASS